MLNPEYQALSLDFAQITEEGTAQRFQAVMVDDNAGDLRAVLSAVKDLLVAAGFTYVAAVAVETDSGSIIFSDEV
jgi:hypothetical protein